MRNALDRPTVADRVGRAQDPDLPRAARRRRTFLVRSLVAVSVAAVVVVIGHHLPDGTATGTAHSALPTSAAVDPNEPVGAGAVSASAPPDARTPTPAPYAGRSAAAGPVGVVQSAATSAPADEKGQPGSSQPTTEETRWRPDRGLTWQWQLSVPVDQSVDVDVYDIDMFENDAAVVASLHAAGRKVICYIDVGGWEDYRPDAADFPPSVLGAPIEGWPSERWLDIRQLDVLRPIMAARFDLCAARGFDGVEPDLMDAASAETGFDLSPADQIAYNLMIAGLAHERGLAVGLKNDLTQIPQLVDTFDFAVNEQCAEYSECEMLVPFIAAGKPVFHAEYDVPTAAFCEETTRLGFSSIRKQLDLGAWLETCA
jgi:hypothetical protein